MARLTRDDGVIGWGEFWCDFLKVGAKHCARLVEYVIAPILTQRDLASPEEVALGVFGKLAGLPLWKLWHGSSDTVPSYASGMNPRKPETITADRLEPE